MQHSLVSPLAPSQESANKRQDPVRSLSWRGRTARAIRRKPGYWTWETLRLGYYIAMRLTAVPWLIVWPALIVWAMTMTRGEWSPAALQTFLQEGPQGPYAFVYLIGAMLHTLTVMAHAPYESEFQRRLCAEELNAYCEERRVASRYPRPRTRAARVSP